MCAVDRDGPAHESCSSSEPVYCPVCARPTSFGATQCGTCGASLAAGGPGYPAPQGHGYPAPQGHGYPAPQGHGYPPAPPPYGYPPVNTPAVGVPAAGRYAPEPPPPPPPYPPPGLGLGHVSPAAMTAQPAWHQPPPPPAPDFGARAPSFSPVASDASRSLAGFLVSFEDPMGSFWPLFVGANEIGRSAKVPWDVNVPSPTTSSHHATLETDGRAFVLVDLGSTNGTFVNGIPLSAGARTPIRHGDELTFGGYRTYLLEIASRMR